MCIPSYWGKASKKLCWCCFFLKCLLITTNNFEIQAGLVQMSWGAPWVCYGPFFPVRAYTQALSFSMWENSAYILQPISLFKAVITWEETSWSVPQQTALASCSRRKPGSEAIWRDVCSSALGSHFPFHAATQLRPGQAVRPVPHRAAFAGPSPWMASFRFKILVHIQDQVPEIPEHFPSLMLLILAYL